MVIFNGKEMPTSYTLVDNQVFEIVTRLSIEELYEKIRLGEEISEEDVRISVAVNGKGNLKLALNDIPDVAVYNGVNIGKDAPAYGSFERYEQIHELAADDYAKRMQIRPDIFKAYESYLYGNCPKAYEFKPLNFDINKPQHISLLRKQLALASGILPTVCDDLDIPFKELKKLSQDGENLVRNYKIECIAKNNSIPTREEIEEYRKLNDYEKRLLSIDYFHPAQFMELKKGIQETRGKGAVFTTADYESYKKNGNINLSYANDSLTEDYKAEFISQYKFAPQIVKEFATGCLRVRGKQPTTEEIKADVASFSRPSIQATVDAYKEEVENKNGELELKDVKVSVAQTRNSALIYLSSKVNFAEIPNQLVKALSVYVNDNNIRNLEDKDFSKWLNATGKNEPVSDVIEAIENVSNISKFKENAKALDLVNEKKLKAANADRLSYENKYNYKFADNELAIKGRHLVVEQGGMKMYMLSKDDLRNFTTGRDTHCCQHYGNAGEACVWKLTTDPFAGNVVIEKNGKILGQAFVWTDEVNGIFVFDNFEFANDGEISKYLNIIGTYAKNLPYDTVQLGMGYTQGMNGIGEANKVAASMPTTLNSRPIYSDYHPDGNYSRARDLKRPNAFDVPAMVKYPINESICRVTTREDEPTRWDILTEPQFSFMLNDCSKTIDERINLARAFLDNPTKELQKQVFDYSPAAILTIDNPDPELQVEMYEKHPDIAKRIPNPCVELQALMIRDNPDYLRHMSNPSNEIVESVMEKNGLLLNFVQNKTPEICLKAVAQNGYAVKFVPESMLSEEIMLEAVKNAPKVASLIDNPPPNVQLEAARKDPTVVCLMDNPTVQAKMAAVYRQPDLVFRLKNPEKAVVKVAVQRNPMSIKKFQYTYPDLRMEAINANGFVVRELSSITLDEYNAAVSQNANVSRFVAPPGGFTHTAQENTVEDIEFDLT